MAHPLDWHRVSDKLPQRSVNVRQADDLGTPIFHYMRPAHLVAALKSQRLWMRNVEGWTDPVEAVWGEEVFGAANQARTAARKKQAFGHCWSMGRTNESIWRLHTDRCEHTDPVTGSPYPPSPPPIRIQSTPQKLVDEFKKIIQVHRGKAYTARVLYETDRELAARVAAIRRLGPESRISAVLASALHSKRREYRAEEEWRVLWIETGDVGDHRELPFDIAAVIDGVMVGPTKRRADQQQVVERLHRAGVPMQLIQCSDLYDTPTWRTETEVF